MSHSDSTAETRSLRSLAYNMVYPVRSAHSNSAFGETSQTRIPLSEIPPLANKRKNTALIPAYAQNERFLKKSASKCSKGLTYLFPYS